MYLKEKVKIQCFLTIKHNYRVFQVPLSATVILCAQTKFISLYSARILIGKVGHIHFNINIKYCRLIELPEYF